MRISSTWGASAADMQRIIHFGHSILNDDFCLSYCTMQQGKLLIKQLLLQLLLTVELHMHKHLLH